MAHNNNETQKQSKLDAMLQQHHSPFILPHQAGSAVIKTINAPLSKVWSVVRQFDKPKTYKMFIMDCTMLTKEKCRPGSVRMVELKSELPAQISFERLDFLDDESHVMVFSIIGGDHRLANYQSTLTLHEEDGGTVVIESFVVDIPIGNTRQETCLFATNIINYNLECLAQRMSMK